MLIQWQVSGLGQDQNITDYQTKIGALVQRLTDLLGPQGNQAYLKGKMKVDTDALSSPQNNKVPQQEQRIDFTSAKSQQFCLGILRAGMSLTFRKTLKSGFKIKVRANSQDIAPPNQYSCCTTEWHRRNWVGDMVYTSG
jgi:hypothetical protein